MYTLNMADADSATSLRKLRSYRRLTRWINTAFFRHGTQVWGRITLPIKAIMYNRTAPTVFEALTAGAVATQAFA
jgi:hypothetical protein